MADNALRKFNRLFYYLWYMQQSFPKGILHPIIRAWIRCTAYFFFEKVIVSGKENIPATGPVILACNHPDSFLDALVVTAYYKRPVYYMARGDVFATKLAAALLGSLNIIPIYRREEGKEHLSKNESTFEFCLDSFNKNGTVLVFSEGGSENKWELRKLRKGTARLAYDAWHSNTIGNKLQVLPVAIAYSGWLKPNNVAYLTFTKPITANHIPEGLEQAIFLRKFNEQLKASLEPNCIIIEQESQGELQKILVGFLLKNFIYGKNLAIKAIKNISNGTESVKEKTILFANHLKTHNIYYYRNANIISFLLACLILPLAFVLNVVPYSISKYISVRTTKLNEFYDSVLFCMLLLIYPAYLISLTIVTLLVSHSCLFAADMIALTLLTAKLWEWSKRNIVCFTRRKEMTAASTMLSELFGKGND